MLSNVTFMISSHIRFDLTLTSGQLSVSHLLNKKYNIDVLWPFLTKLLAENDNHKCMAFGSLP